MKSLPSLIKKAQVVFNSFIRERDKDKGCISCENGRVEQAGHYISVPRSAYLRFNEMNINGQCVRCNCFLNGNEKSYRVGLVNRIGEENVTLLEQSARRVKKWGRLELQNIIITYNIR